ncbi:MAG TPA: hypothetical protein VKJ07_21160, partial [Mycobacteriales bacterium]|nr:hypothetical protein [Mycobacteriales bacterium]
MAVLAGVGIWPNAKDKLADSAASWLQRQWQTAAQYESSRSDIEQAASQRLATGDAPTLVGIVQALDREEADKLSALAGAIGHHHTWTGSVASVGNAMRKAFLAEARDLRSDAVAAPKMLPASIYVESPYSDQTDGLVNRAAGLMARMLHSRHLKPDTKSRAALTSAAAMVADLQRVISAPVDMRLAVMHGAQVD